MSKKKIQLKRFFHRERWRYGIYFGFDDELAARVRNIPDATYSSSNKCWYVPDNEESLKKILSEFRDIADIDISAIASPSEGKKIMSPVPSKPPEDIDFKQDDDYLPDLPTREAIMDIEITPSKPGKLDPVSFSINESDGRLVIKFTGRYDKEWIDELKSFDRLLYDSVRREWSLRWSQLTVDSLSDYFSSRGIRVILEKQGPSGIIKRIREGTGSEVRERMLGEKATSGIEDVRRFMDEKRYSIRTINSYIGHLEFFFKYFAPKDPKEITDEEISSFFHDFIIENKYSASYQNQIISAIKIYYGMHGARNLNSSVFERPRKGRSLPKVFSKEEIMKIFSATRNNKHKLILWLIYSCGLRRSEVINIKLTDLDSTRGTLHIREAKGNNDRMVPIPEKVWEKIRAYTDSYRPVAYLFEGQGGGRYSVESVYHVFKKSVRRAGNKKDVGVHSLRHSYATHLHENGLDIRYIQELLGHKSTRTTEIYTHVSRRNLFAIRSPIEDMDIE
jgi:integrase/recombinase XerD